jgi:hypothetical protein
MNRPEPPATSALSSGECSYNITSSSAPGTGSGFRTTASSSEKIAVLAPMPSASVATAMNVKPGVLISRRTV